MKTTDILAHSQILVKELAEGLNPGNCTFEQTEQRILQYLYQLGHALELEVLSGVQEPTVENSLRVGERRALYSGRRNRRCGFQKLWPLFSRNSGHILYRLFGVVKLEMTGPI